MNLSLGIFGLPNVGKSTLFNALTASSVPAENYPFCTIEPNVGIIAVNDKRLEVLSKIEKSEKIIPAVVKFVDIAGLVKGSSKGEGLGNKFLSHIREVDALVHVIRRFKDPNVVHIDKNIDPKRDVQIVEAELIIKDLESIDKKLLFLEKESKGDKKLLPLCEYIRKLKDHLNEGKLVYSFKKSKEKDINKFRKELFLLTDKSLIYLLNESLENINVELLKDFQKELDIKEGENIFALDIKLEAEISLLDKAEQKEFLNDLGLKERPLDTLINASYSILNLISFFTASEKEARAWTIYRGDNIVKAAGTIHTDFEEKFVAADVISYEDFTQFGGWKGCKETGKIRLEGREYIVKDGDVVMIRHGA